jgi:protein-disulfide isomerase
VKKLINFFKRIPSSVRAIVIIVFAILLVNKYGKSEDQRVKELTQQRFEEVEKKNQHDSTHSNEIFSKIENIFGDKNAKVVLLEYSRFTCSYCTNFHTGVVDKFKKEYVDTGKVLYITHLIIDEEGLLGVVLPTCLNEENKKYEIIQKLYQNSNKWLSKTNKIKELKAIYVDVVGNDVGFDDCIANTENANAILTRQREDDKKFNILMTPTFFINGERHNGYLSYQELKKILDEKI